MTGSLDRDRLGRLLDALDDRLRRANVRASEHLLAMKLEAGRRSDVDDIRRLLDRLGIDEPEEAARIHAHLFPASARRERPHR
jgi:hypothetical protein